MGHSQTSRTKVKGLHTYDINDRLDYLVNKWYEVSSSTMKEAWYCDAVVTVRI